jgi:hypothetical protein
MLAQNHPLVTWPNQVYKVHQISRSGGTSYKFGDRVSSQVATHKEGLARGFS